MAIGTRSIHAGGTVQRPILGTVVTNETPSGALDGTNVTFTLAHTPLAGTVMLYYNGVHMRPGGGNDYTISGSTITMEYPIGRCSTDSLSVWYLRDGTAPSIWTPVIAISPYSANTWDEIYCDTTAIGSFEVTMPLSPILGDSVRFINMNDSFEINNLIIGRNGSRIMGLAENLEVDINRSFDLRYSNATEGWCVY